ncbi:phytoene desaturase family protein [Marinicaulis aureus]|uniref:Pyridine nucleotide-disulfide oxidoreductase domain-containing protein 2 n=1 Tax=Hyphococcus aureus TaxID=2666033 RepID=A0ABW1KUH4_9PROT
MSKTYDVIVLGGGHNGLLAGAYMAKAGMSVCVLERQPFVGGGAVTRELTVPGFRHDVCSIGHMLIQPNPLIANDELNLISKYGLKYLYPETATTVLFPDDSYIAFYRDLDRTCEGIAQYSEHDAESFRKFCDFVDSAFDFMSMGMFAPPPSSGHMAMLLEESEFGQEVLRAFSVSQLDIACDWFESEEMRIASSRVTSEGMISPHTKGSGIAMFWYFALVRKYGLCLPEGGSGAISEAIRACLEDLGGEVRTSATVKRLSISGGDCDGVVLDDGETLTARKAVISALNIKQMPELIGDEAAPEIYRRRVERAEHSEYFPFHIELAMNEAPKYKADIDDTAAAFVEFSPKKMDDYLKVFDDLRRGAPTADIPLLIVPTVFDQTRAPDGKHILYNYNYAPYNVRGKGPAEWDNIKEDYIQDSLKAIRRQTTNMGDDNIIASWAKSPYELEQYNWAMPKGDLMHIGSFIHQSLGNRPIAGWGYKTPVNKLYMCGASTHPGPGVNGAARAAMPVIMEELGLDFEKVVG